MFHDMLITDPLHKHHRPFLDPPLPVRPLSLTRADKLIHIFAVRDQHLTLILAMAEMVAREVRLSGSGLAIPVHFDDLRRESVLGYYFAESTEREDTVF